MTEDAALDRARSDLIVFTDDVVDPNGRWLAELHAGALAHPEVNLFGGWIGRNVLTTICTHSG